MNFMIPIIMILQALPSLIQAVVQLVDVIEDAVHGQGLGDVKKPLVMEPIKEVIDSEDIPPAAKRVLTSIAETTVNRVVAARKKPPEQMTP